MGALMSMTAVGIQAAVYGDPYRGAAAGGVVVVLALTAFAGLLHWFGRGKR